jgi:D-proline reductase (dithiol) PrdB
MVRLSDLPESARDALLAVEIPQYESNPWVSGPPLSERRVAIVSSAGLLCRGDRPFPFGADEYRVIPGDTVAGDLLMAHVSSNFDRTGYQQDLNVIFPIDRLAELAADGVIGSVADFHYSFMGATRPDKLEPKARELAGLLKEDRVNAVLLVPV